MSGAMCPIYGLGRNGHRTKRSPLQLFVRTKAAVQSTSRIQNLAHSPYRGVPPVSTAPSAFDYIEALEPDINQYPGNRAHAQPGEIAFVLPGSVHR